MQAHANELRVSLREIVEVSYRALRVAGVSTGEAQAAARAVQFAELRDGKGLVILASDLESARWDRLVSRVAKVNGEHDRVIELCPEMARSAEPVYQYRGGRIQLGRHLIELAAGTARTAGTRHTFGVSSVIDLPLVEYATSLDCAAVIFENATAETGESDGRVSRVRVVDAGGRLGSGAIERETAVSLPNLVRQGAWVGMMPSLPDTLSEELSWVEPEELARVRADAARRGHLVDAGVWARVRDRARGYLQPNPPENAA